jgi:hypothetical protein
VPSKRSQTQKDKHHLLSHLQNLDFKNSRRGTTWEEEEDKQEVGWGPREGKDVSITEAHYTMHEES